MESLFGIDLVTLIKTVGLTGIVFMVFAESGLLIGFLFPGDSLLFTAGFLASQDYLNIGILILTCFLAAVVGDSVGYYFGEKIGPRIFTKEDSRFFKKEYIHKAQKFYEKYGGRSIVLARFLPVVRTLVPIMAGVGKMSYPHFLFYNIFGGALWSIGLLSLGYLLGSVIPNVDKYIIFIIGFIIVLSSFMGWLEVRKMKKD
ncbi:MAG: VTT domain-containing protein [bacterium]|nr:VTT domain-containing protein [bacterium]